jgi:hypothetical protein
MGIMDLLVFITMYLRAADNKHLELPCLNIFTHDRNEKTSLSTIKTIKSITDETNVRISDFQLEIKKKRIYIIIKFLYYKTKMFM